MAVECLVHDEIKQVRSTIGHLIGANGFKTTVHMLVNDERPYPWWPPTHVLCNHSFS